MKTAPRPEILAGDAWAGTRGVRVYVEAGKVCDIDLLPLGGRKRVAKKDTDRVLAKAIKEIKEYLAGKRRRFTVPFEQKHATAFHEKVYRTLMSVPYGQVVSYGELARLAGAPGAARAVGSAMKRNRLCLLVPCHRVVASNGIGGYNGQLEWKKALLDLERTSTRKQ
jgi:methylated-DNA-[protein]-cysteine S-methyltransferase